jgi:hypothetical protein
MFFKKANHITDTYFHEELSKLIGCEASYEWYKTNVVMKRKWCSSTSLSSQASKQNTPQHSASTTPRRLSLIQSSLICSCLDAHEISAQFCPLPRVSPRKSDEESEAWTRQCRQALASEAGAFETNPLERDESHIVTPPTEQQRCKSPGCPGLKNAPTPLAVEPAVLDRIGLLYTDAAHSVLEDRDVAYYVQIAIGRPLP